MKKASPLTPTNRYRQQFQSFIRLILFCGAFSFTGCAGDFALVHQLTENEANQIMVILGSQGIEATKMAVPDRVVTYTIVVSENDRTDALAVLVANKLPKEKSNGLAEVYPAGGGGMIPSQSEEKAKLLMALQGEIERKLKTFSNVVRAHVSVVVPEKDLVRDVDSEPPQASASVAVIYNPTKDGQSALTAEEIKNLVAASIEGLKPANVQVVLAPNRPINLVSDAQDGSLTGSVATVLGIDVSNSKSGTKVKIFFGLFSILTLLGLGVGLFGLSRSIKLRGELARTQNELDAVEKANEG
ncbi:MAG: hypothetical protein CMH56_17255 [Myxococcales bacterium]|nr:hypothetical protein [Myxococcales bacterium]|tara:strand:- start:197 stop:1096 length:900 start_codon:yes stop_codon:yes gene_type:complete